jgi:hypothetical protein
VSYIVERAALAIDRVAMQLFRQRDHVCLSKASIPALPDCW